MSELDEFYIAYNGLKLKRYSLKEVEGIIEREGLWYAIEHYMYAGQIKDKNLSKLWDDTAIFLRKTKKEIKEYINSNKGKEKS